MLVRQPYTQAASALTPALIIYLIDASGSMNDACHSSTKIATVNQALRVALHDMWRRSMRDGMPQRRYKIAVFAYSTKVVDVLSEQTGRGGIHDLPEIVSRGIPEFSASGKTDTKAAFDEAEKLLKRHLVEFQRCPAPLVCHLTDAVFTTTDPSPTINRIKEMSVEDGPVLVENIYVADNMLRRRVDWNSWGGVLREKDLTDKYARFLYGLSSPVPETYRLNINNYSYHLQRGAALFFPGTHPDLVRLAFAISTATHWQ